jgi:O-antigen chain-terminating methyltransferase
MLAMRRLLFRILQRVARLLGIDEIQHRLDSQGRTIDEVATRLSAEFGAMAQVLERRVADNVTGQVAATNESLVNHMAEVQKTLVFHVDQKIIQIDQALESHKSALEQNDDVFSQQLSQFRQTLDSVRRELENRPSVASLVETQTHHQPSTAPISDSLYVALENRFRGDRDAVRERQREYLPLLGTQINTEHPLVDMGCGRGEWLDLLIREGIPSLGVDSNVVCIAECKEKGLDVELNNIVAFLSSAQDASFGAMTFFQVFEHLPFDVLIQVMREVRRVLVPGGVLIAEVPNAKNVRVGSGTFWIDPTHQRPLFPEVLMFLAEQVGFSGTDGVYANRLGPVPDLSGLPVEAQGSIAAAIEALDGPGDFALIATA